MSPRESRSSTGIPAARPSSRRNERSKRNSEKSVAIDVTEMPRA